MLDPQKLKYETPTIQLVRLTAEDIITNSLNNFVPNYDDMFEDDNL